MNTVLTPMESHAALSQKIINSYKYAHVHFVQMWTTHELDLLRSNLENVSIRDILTPEEIHAISPRGITLDNLRNDIFVPRHNFPVI